PRRTFAELEVDRPEDVYEPAVRTVEGVARKWARCHESGLALAGFTHQQLDGRPGCDGTDVEVRPAGDGPGRRQADPAPDGLREPDPPVADFRLGLDHRELHGRERHLLRPELRPLADPAPARLTVVDDLAPLDRDPGAKLVRLAERVLPPELVDVRDDLRRRLVIV